MDKKQDKQHQNLSLHERYLALLDKHNAENADKPPEEQEGPQGGACVSTWGNMGLQPCAKS